jgi:cobalt/nickel transport system permease protein
VVVDLAYLIYRFLSAAASELAAMQQVLKMRAPDPSWHARLDTAAKLASTLLGRTLARAARVESGLLARGVDGAVWPVGSFATFSPAGALRLAAVPLAVLVGGLL